MACYFVSYNKADRGWAEWMGWQLEHNGHSAIIQAWDFVPGSNFALKMDEAAARADKIIAVLSPHYLEAMYTQPEWAAAFASDPTGKESKLIPVRVQECNPEGLLRQIIYIDLVGLDEEKARQEFLSKIEAGRMRPKVAPAFPGTVNGGVQTDNDQQDKKKQLPLSQPATKIFSRGVPRLTPITDLERTGFIAESFEKLAVLLEQHMAIIKDHNPGVEYTVERIDKRKLLISAYLHGSLKWKIKAWLGSDFGSTDSIKLSYGRNVSDSDNSYNEQIMVEEDQGMLILKPLMQMSFSGKSPQTIEEITKILVDNVLAYYR